MKIATFNIENLFHRDENLVGRANRDSGPRWMKELEHLLYKDQKEDADYKRMRQLSFLLGFYTSPLDPYVVMRRRNGKLYLRQRNAKTDFKASQLSDWNGWIRLHTVPVNEVATKNKAKIISEANPDILLLQEVEDRQSLIEFNEHYLPKEVKFSDIMVIPGNDSRGLEMGILTKNGYHVRSFKSHANDIYDEGKFFDKDFQEFEIITPKGESLWILSVHLTEDEMDKKDNDARRLMQSKLVARIYRKVIRERSQNVLVMGTFNAPSYCKSIAPVIKETDLKDIKIHRSFNIELDKGKDADYHSLGAYKMGVNFKQRDYMLLSPSLFEGVTDSGLNRKGVWPKKKNQYRTLLTLQAEFHQASTHPLVWVEIGDA